jgi:zinc and cadmium transporter
MPAPDSHLLLWILGFTLVGAFLSTAAGGAYLLMPSHWREKTVAHLISLATGTLLAVAFMDLLPEALEHAGDAAGHQIFATVLAGILVFFVLEKTLIWRHAHQVDSHGHAHHHHGMRNAGALVMVGDTFHNFLDGVLLTATFVADPALGVVTGMAIIAHEIPQEVGDFAIMLEGGYSRWQTFGLNAVSSLAMVGGALLAWWQLPLLTGHLGYVLAFTAASFIYIAIADLIPSLHQGVTPRETFAQIFWMATGVLFVMAVHHFEG